LSFRQGIWHRKEEELILVWFPRHICTNCRDRTQLGIVYIFKDKIQIG
jgi:hypothetical protein